MHTVPNYITYHTQRFYDRLRDHLISRCTARDFDGDEYEYLPIERNAIRIKNDELREYNTLQVNYTTYDGRRGQDYFNPRTHYDVMVLGREDGDERTSGKRVSRIADTNSVADGAVQ